MAANPDSPRPAASAKSVLLTVLGELVAPNGGSAWTGTVVDGLAALGYRERNARQALARLGDDGVITSERHGRRTRWLLTADGEELLRQGAERIYRFGTRTEPWNGRWLVVMCAVPESQRDRRRRFQARLTFAGFGFAAPTVAVSAHTSTEPIVAEILSDLDLEDRALVLRADTGSPAADRRMLERSWDLDALVASYEAFVARFAEVRPEGPEASFRELVHLVHGWRQFPFADPELPPELLPPGWAGNVARHLFDDARRTWSPEATTFYKQLEASHED